MWSDPFVFGRVVFVRFLTDISVEGPARQSQSLTHPVTPPVLQSGPMPIEALQRQTWTGTPRELGDLFVVLKNRPALQTPKDGEPASLRRYLSSGV
jgi:hypothetical protein